MTFRARHKIDAGQPAIVKALREAGYSVCHLTQGGGVPDLLVSCYDAGGFAHMWLLEVKEPKGTLTDAQRAFMRNWATPIFVVHTPEEALDFVRVTP